MMGNGMRIFLAYGFLGVALVLLVLIWSNHGFEGLYDPDGQKAIEVVKESKMSLGNDGLASALGNILLSAATGGGTWSDFTNGRAQANPKGRYRWGSEKKDDGIYLVSFLDVSGRGYYWEVTDLQTVVYVNIDDRLSSKYGLGKPKQEDSSFIFTDIQVDTLMIGWEWGKKGIVYEMRGKIQNNTGKTLTKAEITGVLKLVFEDKTVESETYKWVSDSGMKRRVTESSPWDHGAELGFKLRTPVNNVPAIYLRYMPLRAVFEIEMDAEDPIGFSYDKNILEKDIILQWSDMMEPDKGVSHDVETPRIEVVDIE